MYSIPLSISGSYSGVRYIPHTWEIWPFTYHLSFILGLDWGLFLFCFGKKGLYCGVWSGLEFGCRQVLGLRFWSAFVLALDWWVDLIADGSMSSWPVDVVSRVGEGYGMMGWFSPYFDDMSFCFFAALRTITHGNPIHTPASINGLF